MSSTVDNRVVRMTFDNKNFEQNVGTTMRTLDKLKSSLNFSGGKKSMQEIQAASSNVKLEGMSGAIEGVSKKFLALSTIAITALSNITSKVMDTGARMIKALSMDPILDGFKEYELNMNSIQTILANTQSKGSTLQDVNKSLDELNTYADKTIYNFGEMAKNIGTFTAAGVGLEESTRSIKGIANLAALSGSNSQQASTAMYQLSQAMASGTVKLMDWNSVVNAGMGGEVFQNALFETGKALGTLKNIPMEQTFTKWKEGGGSFRDSLREGWITADVLTTTLAGFTGELNAAELSALGYSDAQVVAIQKMAETAVSAATEIKTGTQLVGVLQEAIGTGWATSFRLIIGDFVEAKTLMTAFGTGIGGMIDRISKERNEMLGGWKMYGGRNQLVEGIAHSFAALKTAIAPIKEAFREVFPKKTAKDLILLSMKFNEFAQSLKMGDETVEKVKKAFKGFFSIFGIGVEVIKGIFGVFKTLVVIVARVIGAFSGVGTGAAGFITKIYDLLVVGGLISKFFNGLEKVLLFVGGILVWFAEKVASAFSKIGDLLSPVLGKMKDFGVAIASQFSNLGGLIAPALAIMQTFGSMIASVASAAFSNMGDFFTPVLEKVKAFGAGLASQFSNLDSVMAPAIAALQTFGIILGGVFKTILDSYIRPAMEGIQEFFASFSMEFSSIGGFIDPAMDKIKEFGVVVGGIFASGGAAAASSGAPAFKAAIDGVKDAFDRIVSSGTAVGKALLFISNLFKTTGQIIINIITGVIDFFSEFASNIGSVFTKDSFQPAVQAVGVGFLGGIMMLLRKFVKDGFKIDFGQGKLFDGIIKAFDQLTSALKSLQTNIKANTLKQIAIAVGILVLSLLALSFIDPQKLGIALAAIGASLGALVLAMTTMSKISADSAKIIALGTAMAAMAAGVLLLSFAIKIFGGMEIPELIQGLLGLAGVLGIFAIFTQLVDPSKLGKVGFSFILFGLGIRGLTSSIEKFGTMDWDTMRQGFIGLSLGLLLVVGAAYALDKVDLLRAAVGLGLMIITLAIIAKIITDLGSLDWMILAQGLAAISVAIVLIVASAMAMSGAIAGAFAMIIMAGAMYLLAEAIQTIGKMGVAAVVVGLVAVAAGILLFVVAAAVLAGVAFLLQPLIPVMALLAGTMMLMGIAAALFGAGALLVAFALLTLGNVGQQSITTLINVINQILVALPGFAQTFAMAVLAFVTTFLEGFGQVITIFGTLIGTVLDTITELAPKIGETLTTLLQTALQVIRDVAPDFAATGVELIETFLTAIRDNMENIITIGGDIIVNFLNGIAARIDDIVVAGAGILVSFIQGLTESAGDIGTAVMGFITAILLTIYFNIQSIIDAGFAILEAIIDGLEDGILGDGTAENPGIISTIGDLVTNIIDALADEAEDFMTAGTNAAVQILEGMVSNAVNFAWHCGRLLLELLRGIRTAIDTYAEPIAREGRGIAWALIRGIVKGLGLDRAWNMVRDAVTSLAKRLPGWMRRVLRISSPSKVFMEIGEQTIQGFTVAVNRDKTAVKSVKYLAERTISSFQETLKKEPLSLNNLHIDAEPRIRPVLDLTNVKKDAKTLGSLLNTTPITAQVSALNAQVISSATTQSQSDIPPNINSGPTEIKFEQHIHSPTALATSDIYKQTRSQIAMAKEELKVP